jgi:eukaryotic-like serine/threonine-protein kinase
MRPDDDGPAVIEGSGSGVSIEPEAELSWFSGSVVAEPSDVVAEGSRLVDRGELARGGMASIRRAYDRNILREVAVKRVHPDSDRAIADASPLLLEEAQITGQLEHPNIVPIYDLGTGEDGAPLLVMRLIQGQTLTVVMREFWRGGRNPVVLREILEILLKVCDALSYAHSRGVVHRDLKPDNVMIGSHGQVYVMDWGCALLLAGSDAQLPAIRSRRSAANVVVGTAAYMSPEQARGLIDRVDERADVYSIGAILYQLLTGRPPHRAATMVDSVRFAQAGAVTPPDEVRPEIELPRGLVAITMRALAADPDERYPSIEGVRADLDRFVAGVDWFPRRRFGAGETIVREGDDAYTAYVIESGSCEVSRMVGGQRQVRTHLGPGDVFGETAILTDLVRTATVVATGDVVAIEITRSIFEHRIGAGSWLAMFIRTLARRFKETEQRLVTDAGHARRIAEAALTHLAIAGAAGADGQIEARWSPLRRGLVQVFGVDDAAIRQAIEAAPELVVDEQRDVVIRR